METNEKLKELDRLITDLRKRKEITALAHGKLISLTSDLFDSLNPGEPEPFTEIKQDGNKCPGCSKNPSYINELEGKAGCFDCVIVWHL